MTDISEKTSKKDWKKYRTGNTVEYYDKDNQLACVTWLDGQGNTESEWYIEFFKSNNGSGYDYLKGPYYNPEKPQYAYQERYFYENGKLKELTFKDKDGHTRKNFKYYQNGKKKSVIDNDTQEYWQYNEKGVCTYYRRPIREDEKEHNSKKDDSFRETFYDDNGNVTANILRNKNNEVMFKATFYPNGEIKEITSNYPDDTNTIGTAHATFYENGNFKTFKSKNWDIKFYDNGQVKEITSSGNDQLVNLENIWSTDDKYDYRKIKHQEFDSDGNLIKEERYKKDEQSLNLEQKFVEEDKTPPNPEDPVAKEQLDMPHLSTDNVAENTSAEKAPPTRTIQERIAYLREERAKLNIDSSQQEESRLCSYQAQKQQDNKENSGILALWLRQCQNQI